MKRLTAALTAMVLLCVFTCTAMAREMLFQGTNVIFTRTESHGDETLLEGVRADIGFTLNGYLNWDVRFEPLGDTAEASLSFSKLPEREYYTPFSGIEDSFLNVFELARCNSRLGEYVGNYRNDLADGETKTFTVRMSDYYEYYPVYPSLYLGETGIYHENVYDDSIDDFRLEYGFSGISEERGRGFIEALENFLKIPVYEEDVRIETVERVSYGSYSFSSDYRNSYSFQFHNAVFDDALYFTVSNRLPLSDSGGYYTVDTSEIPGGYGIYGIPLSENDIKYEELKTVYRIDEGASVLSFGSSQYSEDVLLLALSKDNKYIIKFIDRRTMTDISELELFEAGSDDNVFYIEYEDFIVFCKNQYEIKVVKHNSDGSFAEALHTRVPENNNISWDYFPTESHCAFDGERLVIFTEEMRQYFDEKDKHLTVEIIALRADGIGYFGRWENSLGGMVMHRFDSFIQFDGYRIEIER